MSNWVCCLYLSDIKGVVNMWIKLRDLKQWLPSWKERHQELSPEDKVITRKCITLGKEKWSDNLAQQQYLRRAEMMRLACRAQTRPRGETTIIIRFTEVHYRLSQLWKGWYHRTAHHIMTDCNSILSRLKTLWLQTFLCHDPEGFGHDEFLGFIHLR